jgi:alkaline phosphatase D
MDFGYWPFSREPNESPRKLPNDEFESIMRQKYTNQFENVPSFKRLVNKMRAKNGFYAIWDDHDFAWNDARGLRVPKRTQEISRSLFHEFVNCSTNLPHVYYHVDTEFARIIFLDNRSESDTNGLESKIISEEQFLFLKNSLNHNLKYSIICGGISLTNGVEKWSNFKNQFIEFCKLLESHDNILYLGGDIHQNKFIKPKNIIGTNIMTPIQLISSGMFVNYLGVGGPFDKRHNWAVLKIENNKIHVSFRNKSGEQKHLSNSANKFIKDNFTSDN